jgi:hypothetical protein
MKIVNTIKNIFKGYLNLMKDKIGFIPKEKQDLYKKRLFICKSCVYLDGKFCDLCGCYVKAKTKVDFELDKNDLSIDGCPKKYW